MCLMAKYDKLVKYLEECEYHGDTELQDLVDRLGREAQEAEEEVDELNDALKERMNGRHIYYREEP